MLKKIFLAVAMIVSTAVYAQETISDKSGSNETSDLIITAAKLARYGYENKSALPLIQAVEIFQRLGVSQETEHKQKTSVADSVAEVISEESQTFSLDISQLLIDAAKFADGDENLLNIIQSLGKSRGATDGPIYHYDTIDPYSSDLYRVKFKGGESAEITIIGGSTNLDLYIYDDSGHFIVCDKSLSNDCKVSFVPSETSIFLVQIRNLGSMRSSYYFYTN